MHTVENRLHVNGNPMLGYTWAAQAKYGTVVIEEAELFNRPEFAHYTEHEYKVAYAMDLGWRYNIDSGNWYRLKGM